MRVKVKNILWDKRHLYASWVVREFEVYEGDQVPPPKNSAPGTICLTTGIAKFPVRTIDPALIVSVDNT